MNPEVKQKWIDALRSGEYEQTKHHLKTDNGYCCLGVLTDLYIKENNFKWGRNKFDTYEFNAIEGSLCNGVIEWSDFPCALVEQYLIRMNDTEEMTFSEIADYIEKFL